ncbi:hypothetical protein [Halalkalibacter akibai]|uniref:Uncharacterized protein n=1 Tax=Halalkalibacter akibai (strain ATCC 43226 / DSM 21942 / CIP 109018 / JCM 9157 / 1139) TaxID=1236973 RepID=W4QUK5_HALA3|nr:hypothetical protein [Halalkalibacter akibai]GAE35766.1 hypothetical protein JCM9157_2897 [Halalkalibacter akibai JCM 9157]
MAHLWDSFLDEMGLDKVERENANITTLIEEFSGESKEQVLYEIFDFVKKLYGDEECTILWWDGKTTPSTKIVSKADIGYIQNLWSRIVGNYLLFLPIDFDESKINVQDEEEFIGRILVLYSHLILKSPDAYEILYFKIN